MSDKLKPLATPRTRAAVLTEERRIRAAVIHGDLLPVITPARIEQHPWARDILDLVVLEQQARRRR